MIYEHIVTIENVEIVNGESIKPSYVKQRWSSKMQKISIKEKSSCLIENIKGNSFSSSRSAWKGIDLNPYIGKKVVIQTYDAFFHPKESGIWMKFIRVVDDKSILEDNNVVDKIIPFLVNELYELYEVKLNNKTSQGQMAFARLEYASEIARKELVDNSTTIINLPYIIVTDKGPQHLSITLTRNQLKK